MTKVENETAPVYAAQQSENAIIERAMTILKERMKKFGSSITAPEDAKKLVMLKTAELESEVFGALFLTNQHELIEDAILFTGTIDSCSVYSREVIKHALRVNAQSVIFYHNHPSQLCSPSQSDISITKKLKDALSLVDIRVIDHIIVAGAKTYCFSENGLM